MEPAIQDTATAWAEVERFILLEATMEAPLIAIAEEQRESRLILPIPVTEGDQLVTPKLIPTGGKIQTSLFTLAANNPKMSSVFHRIALLTSIQALACCAIGGPALSKVDPTIHKLCLSAKDYLGCVKAQTEDSTADKQAPTVRVIQGETEVTGNSCPTGYAYSGAGYCTNVYCSADNFSHGDGLGGKAWSCPPVLFFGQTIQWGNRTIKATVDSNCPVNPPTVGWQSSCQEKIYTGDPGRIRSDDKSVIDDNLISSPSDKGAPTRPLFDQKNLRR